MAVGKDSLTQRSLRGSLGVLLSRLSGIARSVVLSASFGAGVLLDAFFIALRIPSSLRDLLADGALSSAATSVLTDVEREPAAFRRVFNQILIGFLIVTMALAVAGAVWARPIVDLLVDASYPQEGRDKAMEAFRIMAFYLPIAMWSAMCMAVLSIRGAMLRAMFASSFFNFGMIFGALVLVPFATAKGLSPMAGLVWGTMAGGFLQCIYLSTPLIKSRDLSFSSIALVFSGAPFWKSAELWRVSKLMLPRTVGQGAFVLGMVATTTYATSLGEGYLTYMTNALIIIMVPVGLFGVAGGYAALPLLSRSRRDGQNQVFWKTLDESLLLVTLLSAASVSGLVFLVDPLLILIFEYGSFDRFDVSQNALAVVAMAASIVFTSQSRIQSQALFAMGRTGFVAVSAFLYLGALVGGYALVVPRFGLVGMGAAAVAASAASWFANAVILWHHGRRVDGIGVPLVSLPQVLLIGATALSVGAAGWMRHHGLHGANPDGEAFGRTEALLAIVGHGSLLAGVWLLIVWFVGPLALRNRLRGLARSVLRLVARPQK